MFKGYGATRLIKEFRTTEWKNTLNDFWHARKNIACVPWAYVWYARYLL